jgi:VIT1/CCC1 family predicted Fe2+/Mn2+ transporter
MAALRRAIEAHLGTRQVGRVIYGAIIGMALIVVLEGHPPKPARVVTALVATALAVGLAELYSELIGMQTRLRERVGREHVREVLADVVAVAFGVLFPAIYFVLAAVGAMELDTAFEIAKWSGVALIGFYGFCAARLAGDGVAESLARGVAAGAIGGTLIAFKAIVH